MEKYILCFYRIFKTIFCYFITRVLYVASRCAGSFQPFAEISELLTQLAVKADLVVIQGIFSKQPVEQRHPDLMEGQGQDFDF